MTQLYTVKDSKNNLVMHAPLRVISVVFELHPAAKHRILQEVVDTRGSFVLYTVRNVALSFLLPEPKDVTITHYDSSEQRNPEPPVDLSKAIISVNTWISSNKKPGFHPNADKIMQYIKLMFPDLPQKWQDYVFEHTRQSFRET